MPIYFELNLALISLVVGLILSGAIMLFVRSKLKSVRAERSACNYTRAGSFRTTKQQDIFLFRNVIRTPRPKSNTSSRS